MPSTNAAALIGEQKRLAALERLEILDSLPEQAYDDLVLLASQVCETPIALVSLVGGERQWFKAKVGLEAQETHRDYAFCSHAIETPDRIFTTEDATLDPRFADNPLVTGEPGIRFYAGAPIVTRDGEAMGTVCVIDTTPRTLEPIQRRCLAALARHASALLELREAALDATQKEGALLDINESLEHRIELRTQERDRLWELSVDLLVTTSYDGRLHRVSPSWTKLLGYSEEQLLGTPYRRFSHPDDAQHVDDALRRARRDQRPVSFEDRLRDLDGKWHWIAWTLSPEPGGASLTGVGRNITEAKERQAALDAAESALRQGQKMEAIGQLTGGIAHDFNNLLTGITGSLELLQRRIAQGRLAEVDRYIGTAQTAAKRAAALTHRLLAFARRQTLEARPTDVNKLALEMADLIGRTVGPHIDLEVVGAPDLRTALIDANQLENALLNLCINARDAMPEGGRLTIATANIWLDERAATAWDLPAGPYISLAVTDTGSGMSPEIAKRAFDPFFTTKPLGEGTGLGLSMVYGFARQSNGQVRIYSEEGQGTTVRLYLPQHDGIGEAAIEKSTTELDHPIGSDKMVLVVEDEPTVRTLVAEVLKEKGYGTIEAHDGAAGLTILQSGAHIDLLITDVGLPGGMNGRQLADVARKARPSLRVLFITGYVESAFFSKGIVGEDMGLLTKPFAIETLARRVNEMLAV